MIIQSFLSFSNRIVINTSLKTGKAKKNGITILLIFIQLFINYLFNCYSIVSYKLCLIDFQHNCSESARQGFTFWTDEMKNSFLLALTPVLYGQQVKCLRSFQIFNFCMDIYNPSNSKCGAHCLTSRLHVCVIRSQIKRL